MTSQEIRKRFIEYFVNVLSKKGKAHVEVPSSRLVPENHPTLLFTNSGMVQFTRYFLGEKDPQSDFGSRRLCSIQKCIRTGDLDIVGKSKYHLTFFEMLGSWSIGDYGKKEAVEFSFDLLTNKEYGFGFDSSRLIPTVFAGSKESFCDHETIDAWKSVGIPENRISKLEASENWWAPAGLDGPGPCGPCTEVLYDRGDKYGKSEDTPGQTDNPRYVEIWNAGVFMEYNRDEKGKLSSLPLKSVDTGAGLERFAVLLQGVDSVYETDLFAPIVDKISSMSNRVSKMDMKDDPTKREALYRSADHIKAICFIASENVYPSNKDQGYVLRRLIRETFTDFTWILNISPEKIEQVVPMVIDMYKGLYPEVNKFDQISEVLKNEYDSYKKIADNARRFIKRDPNADPFDIYQSTGASVELVKNLISETGQPFPDFSDFEKRLKEHQNLSRQKSGKKFKGGLSGADGSQKRLHTATHLLQQALREVFGDSVRQMGSNITSERLRFDFAFERKITAEELRKVEEIVNSKINESLPVKSVSLLRSDAEKSGALSFFGERYGDKVTVYYIGKDLKPAWSKEFCGGPHVQNTSEIKNFRIVKEKAVGKGVRRIKAVVD